MVAPVVIAGRRVAPGEPCLIVAEAGVNHNGDPELALQLVDAAASAGADAVKFQTFSVDSLLAADAPKAPYQLLTTPPDESQAVMLRALELPGSAYPALVERSVERGVLFLSTPFDAASVSFLVDLGVPALKIASPDLTNPRLLEQAASSGLPLLVSTGMATLDEVAAAVATVRGANASGLVLLHCVSAYPAEAADANLRAIQTLEQAFAVPVGFSDHTLGLEAGLAAVALGACVLEKHLTLDRSLPGPDHAASLEPESFAALVRGVRIVEAALGDGVKRPAPSEEETRLSVRRSLAAARDLEPGTVLEPEMLTALRPGTGIAPTQLPELLGRRTARALRRGELLSLEDVV